MPGNWNFSFIILQEMSETKSFVAIYFPETYVSYISVLVTYSNIYYIATVRTFNLKLIHLTESYAISLMLHFCT